MSLKEGPIKNLNIVLNLDFGSAGITIPAHAEVLCPVFDTWTGKVLSYKATIRTADGQSYEVEPVVLHDFDVAVESNGKLIQINAVITQARAYMTAISDEMSEAERRFG